MHHKDFQERLPNQFKQPNSNYKVGLFAFHPFWGLGCFGFWKRIGSGSGSG